MRTLLLALVGVAAPAGAQSAGASDATVPGSWRSITTLRLSPDVAPTAAERAIAARTVTRLHTVIRAAAPDERLRGVEARFTNWLADPAADEDRASVRGVLQPSVSVPFHEKYRDCAGCPSITAMEPGAGIEIVMNAPEAILAHAATASNGERYYTHARPLPARHGLQAFERLDARHWPAYVVTRPGAPPLTLPVTRAEYVAAVIRELEGERGAVTGDLAQGVSALEREVAAARARRDAAAVQAASEALREMRKASVELQGGGVASDGVAQLRRELAAMSPVDRRRPAYLAVTHADSADDVEEKGRVMSRLVDDARNGVPVVRINPAYWDRRLPRTTPQLLIIAFSRRHDREAEVSDANMHRALREVEDALDWSALRAIVERPER